MSNQLCSVCAQHQTKVWSNTCKQAVPQQPAAETDSRSRGTAHHMLSSRPAQPPDVTQAMKPECPLIAPKTPKSTTKYDIPRETHQGHRQKGFKSNEIPASQACTQKQLTPPTQNTRTSSSVRGTTNSIMSYGCITLLVNLPSADVPQLTPAKNGRLVTHLTLLS
jgi:hypothetical protein